MIHTDEDVLMMMEMTARAERDAGWLGWCKPPKELRKACIRLVSAGLAEKNGEGHFRPTTKGAELVAPRIHRMQ